MDPSADQSKGPAWIGSDLAPGDGKSAALNLASLSIRAVTAPDDRAFRPAYDTLWDEFGAGGGMETENVISMRLGWQQTPRADGWTLYYQLLTAQDPVGWAAVRDHSIIIPPVRPDGPVPGVIVHLSHLLIAPPWRRTGLAGWMRAMPLQAARDCLRLRAWPRSGGPITLVAEMDPPLPGKPERADRFRAYGKAGFRRVDPAAIRYLQPDFRSPEAIDTAGGPQPLPMELLIRRVGREGEDRADGAEIHALLSSLYRMCAEGCRPHDIEPPRAQVVGACPGEGMGVALLSPIANLDA